MRWHKCTVPTPNAIPLKNWVHDALQVFVILGAQGTSLALKIIKFPMVFFIFESKAGAMRSR